MGGLFSPQDSVLQGNNNGSSNQWGPLPSSNPTTSPSSSSNTGGLFSLGGTTINTGAGPGAPASTGVPGYPTTSTYPGAPVNPGSSTGANVGGLPTLGASSSANNNSGSIISPLSPSLSQAYLEYLATQIGNGLPQFQGNVNLPTGGATQPGQLTAGENPTLQALQTFFSTGQSSDPALQSLSQMATTGDPINVTPEWQAMVQAMQQPIAQGAAGLQEQFANAGAAQSSVYGTALGDYYNQANLQEQSLLGQLSTTAQQQAVQNELTAQGGILGADQTTSQYLQGLDQSAINNLIQNYYSTLAQTNPLNSELYGGSTTFPSYVSGNYGTSASSAALGGAASLAAAGLYGAGAGTPTGTAPTFPTTAYG
jgi:hypothetical protein